MAADDLLSFLDCLATESALSDIGDGSEGRQSTTSNISVDWSLAMSPVQDEIAQQAQPDPPQLSFLSASAPAIPVVKPTAKAALVTITVSRDLVAIDAQREKAGVNPCTCKKSKCLKKYCECFAAGRDCAEDCTCIDCGNTPEVNARNARKRKRELVCEC